MHTYFQASDSKPQTHRYLAHLPPYFQTPGFIPASGRALLFVVLLCTGAGADQRRNTSAPQRTPTARPRHRAIDRNAASTRTRARTRTKDQDQDQDPGPRTPPETDAETDIDTDTSTRAATRTRSPACPWMAVPNPSHLYIPATMGGPVTLLQGDGARRP